MYNRDLSSGLETLKQELQHPLSGLAVTEVDWGVSSPGNPLVELSTGWTLAHITICQWVSRPHKDRLKQLPHGQPCNAKESGCPLGRGRAMGVKIKRGKGR